MDPLSDVLSLLKLRTYAAAGLDAGGSWSLQYPKYEGIKCYALLSGQCWLSVDDVPDPVRLETGDCLLLPSGRPFRIASDLTSIPVDAYTVFLDLGSVRTLNGGGECFGFGAHFSLTGDHAGVLLRALPTIIHLKQEADKTALRWSLEQMMLELREPQPGGFLVAQQLACMILVKALRLYLSQGLSGGVGWLFALADKQMSAAITAMHKDPAHRWTLRSLAERAGMSRTIFALKFKKTVGASPMEYLTHWRMLAAADRLTSSSDSVSAIAHSLGYESESAFCHAFKRVMGCAPRQYCRRNKNPLLVEQFGYAPGNPTIAPLSRQSFVITASSLASSEISGQVS
jgi:AraC-like DNA-binding protein